MISLEQCRFLAEGKIIYLADQFLEVEYDTKHPIVIIDGPTGSTNGYHCDGRSWITQDTSLARTTLKVRLPTGNVLSDSAQVLSCALEELGCETTSLDHYAYIWDYPDNCVLSFFRTEDVYIVKQGKKYYIISGPDSPTKFVFEVKNNPQKDCGNPTDIYAANYDSLFVAKVSWGLDWRSGRILGKERNGATQLLQYLAPLRTMDLLNFFHTTRNPRATKQVMKTCIWKRTMKCTWDQNWTTSSSKAHDYFKPLKCNSWKTKVSQNEHRSLIFWWFLLKTHAWQDKC